MDAPIDVDAGLAFLASLNAASPMEGETNADCVVLHIGRRADEGEEGSSSPGPEPLTFSEETGRRILVNDRRAPAGNAVLNSTQALFIANALAIGDSSIIGATLPTRIPTQSGPQIFTTASLWGPSRKKLRSRRTGISFCNLLQPSETMHRAHGVSVTAARTARFRIGLEMAPPSKRAREPMNESFKNEHPWIHRSVTHSKLKNLKWDLFALLESVPGLEPTTAAMAWVYFERLVVMRVVRKVNRKRLLAACLLLAFKFNQALQHHRLRDLLDGIRSLDKTDGLTPRDIYSIEFSVFALVGFELQLAFSDVAPHLREYYASQSRQFEDDYGAPFESFQRNDCMPLTRHVRSDSEDRDVFGMAVGPFTAEPSEHVVEMLPRTRVESAA